LGCNGGERVRRRTDEKARGTTLWSRRFASDVMTLTTSVNDGLWTEDITSAGSRKRDRPDVHGTTLT